MSKKTFRSEYIQNLIADKDSMVKTVEEATKNSLQSIMENAVKGGLASAINEAKDDEKEEETDEFDVEEVGTDTTDNTETTDTDLSDITTDTETSTDDITADTDTDDAEGETDDEFMSKLDSLTDEEGDIDLTGMDEKDLVKVYKLITPDDHIVVTKKDNGTIEVKDEEHDTEFIIDVEGNMDCEDGECDLNEENLGYTDNYQNKTAMTTPDNHEPGKHVRDWDKGVPHGTEKPWVGNKGNMSPYDQNVNEGAEECTDECEKIFEMEVECEPAVEEATSVGNNNRMSHHVVGDTNKSEAAKVRHKNFMGQNGGEMNESKELANLRRKANAIFNENKQLRAIAESIKTKLNEAVVMNACLAKVVNLVTENTTNREEKINIVNRFNNVKTLEESKVLYEQISNELKNAHANNAVANAIDNQLTEAKQNEKSTIVETSMLKKSKDLSQVQDLMKRVMSI